MKPNCMNPCLTDGSLRMRMEMKMSPSEQREERRDEEERSDIIIIIISSAQMSQQNHLILSEPPAAKANLWIQNSEQNRPELGSEKVLFRYSFPV